MRRRVYVSGCGAVSGFGIGCEALAAGIFAGERAVRPRERTAGFEAPTTVAAEIPAPCLAELGASTEASLPEAVARQAALEALEESGHPDPATIGLVLATTKGDLRGVMDPVSGAPAAAGLGLPARLGRALSARLGLRGVCAAVTTACASGLNALAVAERRIARGEEERILVVGVDTLCEFLLVGFGSLHALDPDPCRPFDVRRRGISLGDAAAAILLTAHESESLGVLVAGHGGANDAAHVTRPDEHGSGLLLAARRALARAGTGTGDIDVIHVHGTGTLANDSSEALGLARLFGETEVTAPAFGTKAQTGHTLGAAGVLETVIAIEALRRAAVPANVGLDEQGVDRRLDLSGALRRLTRARRALKVAGGFGGVQAAVVLEA